MTKAYTRLFEFNGQAITSVVMDEDEFYSLCDELAGVFNIYPCPGRVENEQITKLKNAKHIPMMQRGTKTQRFFDRYQIVSDLACFIVRGQGQNVLTRVLKATDPELN
jgi:hypothetical protein